MDSSVSDFLGFTEKEIREDFEQEQLKAILPQRSVELDILQV